MLFFSDDHSRPGHILGSPGERSLDAVSERKLSPIANALLRLLTHIAMFIGANDFIEVHDIFLRLIILSKVDFAHQCDLRNAKRCLLMCFDFAKKINLNIIFIFMNLRILFYLFYSLITWFIYFNCLKTMNEKHFFLYMYFLFLEY